MQVQIQSASYQPTTPDAAMIRQMVKDMEALARELERVNQQSSGGR